MTSLKDEYNHQEEGLNANWALNYDFWTKSLSESEICEKRVVRSNHRRKKMCSRKSVYVMCEWWRERERERERKEGEEDKERMCGCVWMRVDVRVWVCVCDARRREKEREREMKRESIVIVVFGRFLSSDRLAGHQMKLLTQLLPFPLSSKRTHRHSPSLSISLCLSLFHLFPSNFLCSHLTPGADFDNRDFESPVTQTVSSSDDRPSAIDFNSILLFNGKN